MGHLPLMHALASRADALIELITVPPPPGAPAPRRFKRPLAAFEAVCVGVAPILDAVTQGDAGGRRLAALFAATAAAGVADCGGGACVAPPQTDGASTPPTPTPTPESRRLPRLCRILTHLLTERPETVGGWLAQDAGARVLPLVAAIGAAPVAEFIARVAGGDPDTPLPPSATAWVPGSGLVEALVTVAVDPGARGASGDHAAQVLCAGARAPTSPLGDALAAAAPAAVDAALAAASGGCRAGAGAAARLIACVSALLEPPVGPTPPAVPLSPPVGSPRLPASPPPPPPSPLSPQEAAARLTRGVAAVAPRAGALAAVVAGGGGHTPPPPIETAAGILSPPLGAARLAAADVLATLLATPHPGAAAAAVEAGAPAALVSALLSHPHHTILHSRVVAGLTQALGGEDEGLTIAIAGEGSGLVAACVCAPPSVPGRGGASVASSHRAALADIAAALAACERVRPAVAAALAGQPAWKAWRDGALAASLAARGPAGWRVAPPRRGSDVDSDGDTPMAAVPPADDPFRDGDGPVGAAGAVCVAASVRAPLPASPPDSWEEEEAAGGQQTSSGDALVTLAQKMAVSD